MTTSFSRNRRDFLRNSACATLAAASSGALLTQLGMIGTALAGTTCAGYPAVDDYRALVCLFLFGGNDSFNLIVPTDTARNVVYAASRGAMAVPREQLLPINVQDATSGHSYGLHPSCAGLAELFDAGDAAFIVNTGTLLQPTRKVDYLAPGYPLPPQLFSHSDQQAQWQYGQPTANGAVGWGGLLADRLHVLNPGATIPMSISLGGQNRFQTGASIQPYAMTSAGASTLRGYTPGSAQLAALQELLEQTYPDPFARTHAGTFNNALEYSGAMTAALEGVPPLATVFPADNGIAAALSMVAKVIAARQTLGAKRQVFFLAYGGFDTHSDQLADQPALFSTISTALAAFNAATIELGVHDAVTSFTMSEFGRTLNSDGNGTDHAWAGNQIVMGGAVRGSRLYGTAAASGGVYPDLHLDGPDCLQRGQMIPGASTDQFSATLARWMGVNDCDIATIFPYVGNFPTIDLGFFA